MSEKRENSTRAAMLRTTVLSIVLAPLILIGPFIAGYVGGRKARDAQAALIAALGPAILWMGFWWWLSRAGVPVGNQNINPPADMFAPTTGIAILAGALAGSGGRTAHLLGAIGLVVALGWFGRGAKDLYGLYRHVMDKQDSGAAPVTAENRTCPDRLKKLYLAALNYSDSWDGQLPPAKSWMSALRHPDQQFGEEEFLHCPDVSTGTGDQYGYAMNSALGGKRISEIKEPGMTPLFFDSAGTQKDAEATAPDGKRHGGKSNVVFSDGTIGQL